MKNEKGRYGWIIVVIVLLLLPLIYFGVAYCVEVILPHKRIENYYRADTKSFDGIAEYFKNLYKENLYSVEFDYDNTYLEYKLKYADENGKIRITTEKVDCTNADFVKELLKLREKYQKYCEYPIFTHISASYDTEGKMLLYMTTYNETINAEECKWYYLLYVEEGCSGKNSSLEINLPFLNHKPFEGNWYTWSKAWPFG